MRDGRILLKHGAGGRAMRRLIGEVLAADPDPVPGGLGLADADDGAAFPVGDRFLVFTTDAHVVTPWRFPGGDIGRLAACGTVNDLAVMGGIEPFALSCALILEEGFAREDLETIWASLRAACREAGLPLVTGDTKVVGRGEIDGVALSTSGLAWAPRVVRDGGLRVGDRLLVSGTLGDHGLAVMAARAGLALGDGLRSDVAPVVGLVRAALAAGGTGVTAMKDPTRGGLAASLHEMAEKAGVGILLEEAALPVRESVRAASELLGIDPWVAANEGKVVLAVAPEAADRVLAALRAHPLGAEAAIVGTVTPPLSGRVVVDTGFGRRLLPEPDGELLPRIC